MLTDAELKESLEAKVSAKNLTEQLCIITPQVCKKDLLYRKIIIDFLVLINWFIGVLYDFDLRHLLNPTTDKVNIIVLFDLDHMLFLLNEYLNTKINNIDWW